jgi:hypothetical protein
VLLILGSLRLLISNNNYLRTIKTQDGFQPLFKRNVSTTGSLMLRIGASQETDTGVTLFPFGQAKIWKNSFALDPFRNSESYPDAERSRISIEKALIISPFLQNKVRVY